MRSTIDAVRVGSAVALGITLLAARAAGAADLRFRAAHGPSHPAPFTAPIAITPAQRAALVDQRPATTARTATIRTNAIAAFTELHAFAGPDGAFPQGALVQTPSGSLLGETQNGGAVDAGTLYSAPSASGGTFSVTHSFGAGSDGNTPFAGERDLVDDFAISKSAYGITQAGGARGQGAIFRSDSGGAERVVYSFSGGVDGGVPQGRLLAFVDGKYYGTTSAGGALGRGTVFSFDPKSGALRTLHAFSGGPADGGTPLGGLSVAISGYTLSGNLFGTTSTGGQIGAGTIFAISPSGAFATIYNFANSPDGAGPVAELAPDFNGNLYGVANSGGVAGGGLVFRTDVNGNEVVLKQFLTDATGNFADGALPLAPITVNYATGVLYGTTSAGGDPNTSAGVVFRISSAGAYAVLHRFNGNDGGNPAGKLLVDYLNHALYGTTQFGGSKGSGNLFALPLI